MIIIKPCDDPETTVSATVTLPDDPIGGTLVGRRHVMLPKREPGCVVTISSRAGYAEVSIPLGWMHIAGGVMDGVAFVENADTGERVTAPLVSPSPAPSKDCEHCGGSGACAACSGTGEEVRMSTGSTDNPLAHSSQPLRSPEWLVETLRTADELRDPVTHAVLDYDPAGVDVYVFQNWRSIPSEDRCGPCGGLGIGPLVHELFEEDPLTLRRAYLLERAGVPAGWWKCAKCDGTGLRSEDDGGPLTPTREVRVSVDRRKDDTGAIARAAGVGQDDIVAVYDTRPDGDRVNYRVVVRDRTKAQEPA